MAEAKEMSIAEVRRTITTALAAAFGFVIGLTWNGIVQGALTTAGLTPEQAQPGQWNVWLVTLGIGVLVTVIMIVLIFLVSRWGSKA